MDGSPRSQKNRTWRNQGILSAITELDINTISADTKKKELIGNFKDGGQTWNQQPELVDL